MILARLSCFRRPAYSKEQVERVLLATLSVRGDIGEPP
jgi:hypothetical protein